MTTGIRDSLGVHANALVLRNERNNLLASNIANAATPGFKARDIDFSSHLQSAMGVGSMRTGNERHFATNQMTEMGPGYRVPLVPSMDGNTVELSVEQMEFSENTLKYQTSLELLNRRISGLMSVIRGE